MAVIADQKAALEKWLPIFLWDVVLKDGIPRFWAKSAITFAGNLYQAIVLEHSELKLEGNGIYGVDAVAQIGLTLNNADSNLNSLIVPANWQGGIIQPRFIFVAPDGTTTTDSIVYPKFLIDLPSSSWPRVEFSAHNRWNFARKMLPASLVTKKDRYPFPDTAAERTAAGSDPSSPFFALGYDPDTGKGNMNGGAYYRRHEYDGTREMLRTIGLEVRFGGFGKVPPTVVGTPKKGEKSDYVGNANEAKYGQAVPLVFGTCRIQPIVLDTGFPSGEGGWNGARLSHYLLSDGVSFGPEHAQGIEDVLDVFIPDSAKYQRIPETSNEPSVFGAWSFQGGYYGSQKAPASSKYRNIDESIDFPDPLGDFVSRDLYSGLAYLEIGFPKELSGADGVGPKLEAIVKGLHIESWDSGGTSTWGWTDNPVWVFVHLLKLLRWTTDDMDKPTIAAAAAFCDEVIGSGKPRFRCNLALMNQTRANDLLRGVRNNCRMYTSFAADGKLQLRIARNVAGEGGLAFTLDSTTIMRGDDGQLMVEKFHRSIFETANVFSCTFQNEENAYNSDSVTMTDVRNVNQIDEKISADSIFPMLGIPSFDQAERQLEWARQEQVTLNEYYRVTASFALIEAKVGQIGTITEPRHALIGQQVRIRAMAPGPDAGTVELVLQKHSDGAYTDQSVETPFTRAQADSSYTPRSVGGKFASSPAPVLTEVIVAGPTGLAVRRIKVEFKPPARDYEGSFSRATKISDVVVETSGGTIPGDQVMFVEVAPLLGGLRGLASEYLMAVIPSGGNTNKISLTCELPPEADGYILFVGNFPGQTYEQAVEPSPGTAPFTITVTGLFRNFGSIPPDPAYDHASIFYKYNSSPNVLRDGGRTFSPTETTLEFEPEFPAGNDTQVTVYVSSTNAAEDDFYPIEVSPKATLTLTQEGGKAMGWTAKLLPGPTPSSVIPVFTRPTTNGKRLFWVAGQLKDSSVGVWRETDEGVGASVVYYDGSAISHESIGGIKIKKDPGQPLGFGTAPLDSLMLLDVAGGSFDVDRCQWGTVEQFLDDLGAPTTAANARYIVLTGGLFRPQTTQDLRMKIVKPHHTWDAEGYLGNAAGTPFNGVFWEWVGDREGDEFVLSPVEIGRDISSVDVRFWLENDYCRSGGGKIVSDDHVSVRAARDNVLPGQVENLLVVAHGPEFIATWNDPLTGKATLDDATVQYAIDAGFTSGVITAGGLGHVNRATGLDPGKTYYFRVAVRNQSGLPNHADTTILGTLGWGTTGWGPWKAFGAPTAVTSSASTGPTDSVIPGPVQSLVVTGANGNFVADWLDPATGNLTLDDIGIEWATNPGFTIGVERAKGWGAVNHVQSTLPGKTYYFRIAAHNQSGAASHSSTSATLGTTGWGPWTAYGAPTAVASGGIPGVPFDSVIPGPVVSLSVTGGDGKFVATWTDPATGNQTLDDTAIQYATDSAFSAVVGTAAGWGAVNRLTSTDPGKTYWFRVAVHNQSNAASDPSTTTWLGSTGWGPWTPYGAAVYSSGITGAPIDSIIPGAVVGLIVTGGNGDFTADWDNPATGFATIDDVAIQWARDSAFASVLGTAAGWGPVTHLRSTDPEKTYWFRVAAHNQSNAASHASTTGWLGATGWGPWTNYGSAVSSGTIPGAGWQSTGENLCPNFSFELDTDGDGIPDDCTCPFNSAAVAGSARATGGIHGNYAFYIPFGPGTSVALGGFAVTRGDRLSISCKTLATPVTASGGFIFQAAFHGDTRQFSTPAATVNIVSSIALPGSWTQHEGQVTVPNGMNWCRIVLGNYSGDSNYYFDEVVVTRTATGNDIAENTIPANRGTGDARTEYVETFENPLTVEGGWSFQGSAAPGGGGGVEYRVEGVDGGKTLRVYGALGALAYAIHIPYDSRKLYRVTARLKLITISDAARALLYLGVGCRNAAKVDLGQAHVAANGFNAYTNWSDGQWHEVTGWFKGTGTPFAPAADSQNPSPLLAGTAYIYPEFFLNWDGDSATTTGGNQIQIDDYRIEIFDEATYTSPAPDGTFSNLTRQVTYPWQGEAGSSTVTLYWDYTDGMVKAQQFAIGISDGAADWVERVAAPAGTGAVRHAFTIYRLSNTRAVTISIYAESIRPGGQVVQTSGGTWGTFTPSANFGSDPGGWVSVGSIDWAQGNIWFDSYQYRNNVPPSNGTSASIYVEWPESGSGDVLATIKNLTYTQGSYIATHLAVLVRFPSGSIDLNRDMVVAQISLSLLPSTYVIPIGLADNGSYSVAVVAVARTKNGAVPNTTYTPISRSPGGIRFLAYNSPRQIEIGDSGFPGETAYLYAPLRMQSPYATLTSFSGSTYQGGFSGDANGVYMVNSSNKGIQVKQGANPNVIFGSWGVTPYGTHQGCIYISDGVSAVSEVAGGGYLVSVSGVLYWVNSTGFTRLAPPP